MQPTLFAMEPVAVPAAEPSSEERAVGARLPASLRFGTMSWSYKGWVGRVYGAGADPAQLGARGLTAYATHPLLRAVEIDRSYYEPLPVDVYREFAAQVPEDFRFLVKAHEVCVVRRYPTHARYGKRRGELNALYLDAGLRRRGGRRSDRRGARREVGRDPAPVPTAGRWDPGVVRARAPRVHRRPAARCPLRGRDPQPQILSADYGAALAASGALHAHNVWPGMPSILEQARRIPPTTRRPLIVRWLMRAGDAYAEASAVSPFDRLQSEDVENREDVARPSRAPTRMESPRSCSSTNKPKDAPGSILRLARTIASRLAEGLV